MTWHPLFGYAHDGEDITRREVYASTLRAFGEATAPPAFVFHSKAFSDLEDEKIWTRSWVCVGPHTRIPAPGDLLPHTVGNHGVHLRRQDDYSLRGFFNFAQHGGCRFVPRQCQTGNKTRCSYTACGYSHDRDIILGTSEGLEPALTYQYVGVNPSKLMPIGVATCGPLAFVNLDVQPEGLEHQWGPLEARLQQYFSRGTRHVKRLALQSRCNWKAAGRAFLERYGAPGEDTQRQPLDLDEASGSPGSAWWGSPAVDSVAHGDSPVRVLAHLERPDGGICVWLFPNLLLQLYSDHCISCVLQPAGLAQTVHYFDLYRVGMDADARDKDAGLIDSWTQSCEEQVTAGERKQAELVGAGEAAKVETNPLVWAADRYLLQRVLAQHEYFVNKPLYTHPGRSLNAGVNSGAQ